MPKLCGLCNRKLRYSQFFLTWRSVGSRPARRCLGRPASAPCHLSEDTRAEDWLRSPPQTPRRPRWKHSRSPQCRRSPPPPSCWCREPPPAQKRSEEHTSELQSLMRISYAVFCLKKKTHIKQKKKSYIITKLYQNRLARKPSTSDANTTK